MKGIDIARLQDRATFIDIISPETKAVIDAMVDYNWNLIKKKVLVDGMDYDEAIAARMAEIIAEGSSDA